MSDTNNSINIVFRQDETKMQEMLKVYENLYEKYYPQILQYSHHKLWERANREFVPSDWKEFLSHPKVQDFYDTEMRQLARQRVFKTLLDEDNSRSTGEAQQLQQNLNLLKEGREQSEKQDKIVYMFVPLTSQEEASPNVKKLDNIPPEIKSAIQYPTKRNKQKE